MPPPAPCPECGVSEVGSTIHIRALVLTEPSTRMPAANKRIRDQELRIPQSAACSVPGRASAWAVSRSGWMVGMEWSPRNSYTQPGNVCPIKHWKRKTMSGKRKHAQPATLWIFSRVVFILPFNLLWMPRKFPHTTKSQSRSCYLGTAMPLSFLALMAKSSKKIKDCAERYH